MNSKTLTNPFDVLGIDETASDAEVKKAYFQMVRQFTPEKHAEQFKQIRDAYDLLKDPSLRLEAEVFRSYQSSKSVCFGKCRTAPDKDRRRDFAMVDETHPHRLRAYRFYE